MPLPFKGGLVFNILHTAYLMPKIIMFRKLLVLILLILWLPACLSQLPEDFPTIDKTDLPGAKISSSRTFNGTSLFGYIDGGAELYLEYGFSAVLVTEIELHGREI